MQRNKISTVKRFFLMGWIITLILFLVTTDIVQAADESDSGYLFAGPKIIESTTILKRLRPMKKSKRKSIRSRTVEIRRSISSINLLSSGTLHVRTKVCGRSNCRCATDPDARHGPYYEWNRRIDGRLVHRIISEEQSKLVAQAIANFREVKRLLSLWERETANEILTGSKAKTDRNPS